MMGRSSQDQGQLFYSFNLEDVVPDDHLVRQIAMVLDLSWVRTELAPDYSPIGRPSIDPLLMIRMLITGYVFASHRATSRLYQTRKVSQWAQRVRSTPESGSRRHTQPLPSRARRRHPPQDGQSKSDV